MKKKIFAGMIGCFFVFSLCSCGGTSINVSEDNDNELHNTVLGRSSLKAIGDGLYYDSSTRIVYWHNGNFYGYGGTMPTAYYAPNGLPYKYNPQENIFEEIEK